MIEKSVLGYLKQPLCVISKTSHCIIYKNNEFSRHSNIVSDVLTDVLEIFQADEDYGCEFPTIAYAYFRGNPHDIYEVHYSEMDNGDLIALFTQTYIDEYAARNPFLCRHELVVDFLQNAPCPLHTVNHKGIFLWANKFEHDLFRMKGDDDMCGCSVKDFNCKAIDSIVMSKGFQRLHKGEENRELRLTFQARDNTVKTMAVTANAKLLSNGGFYTRSILRDDTEGTLQNNLQVSISRSLNAQRTAQSKDILLRQIFHDIKTPLQVLSSLILSYTLFNSVIEYEYYEYAKNRLIGILLDVTLLIGEYTYTSNLYDIKTRAYILDYILKIKSTVDYDIRSGQTIQFHTHLPPNRIVPHIYDHPLIYRSLFHLLRNAYMYSPDEAIIHVDIDIISSQAFMKQYQSKRGNSSATSSSLSSSSRDETGTTTHTSNNSSRKSVQSVHRTTVYEEIIYHSLVSVNDEERADKTSYSKAIIHNFSPHIPIREGIGSGREVESETGNKDTIDTENKKHTETAEEDIDLDDLRCIFRISNNYDFPINVLNIKRRFMDIHEMLYQDSIPIADIRVEDSLNLSSGKGLGLSIVYQITKYMNGALDCYVEDNLNHFVFSVPLLTIVDPKTYKEIKTKLALYHDSQDIQETDSATGAITTTTGADSSNETTVSPDMALHQSLEDSFPNDEKVPSPQYEAVYFRPNKVTWNHQKIHTTSLVTNTTMSNYIPNPSVENNIHTTSMITDTVNITAKIDTTRNTCIPQSISVCSNMSPSTDVSILSPISSARKCRLHILVVEDSIIIQKLMTRHLVSRGHTYTCANNGQEAVDCIQRHPDGYHAILMDLRMPVMDGLTALQRIRTTQYIDKLPIYIVSAETTKSIQDKATLYGSNGFFGKPVNMNNVIDILENVYYSSPSYGQYV